MKKKSTDDRGVIYKNRLIKPYQTFYSGTTERFFRGGLDVCRTLKSSSIDVCVCVEEDKSMDKLIEIAKLIHGGRSQSDSRIYDSDGLAPTLKVVSGGNMEAKMSDRNYRLRRLTPREYWRLMGFDDEDFDKAEQVCSNRQLYKQAGNALVPQCLEGIFKNMNLT